MSRFFAAVIDYRPVMPKIKAGRTVLTIALMAAAILIGSEIPNHLMVALTNSVGHRLFYYEREQKNVDIKKDSYVVFPLYTDLRENCNPCRVVKKAACVEGEHLKTDENGYFFCVGQYLGVAKRYTSDGSRKLSPFIFDGEVPVGKFFAYGGNINSYDSRYYGFVDQKVVEGVATPLF